MSKPTDEQLKCDHALDTERHAFEQIARRNPAVYGGLAAPLVFDIGFDNSQRSPAGRTNEESA